MYRINCKDHLHERISTYFFNGARHFGVFVGDVFARLLPCYRGRQIAKVRGSLHRVFHAITTQLPTLLVVVHGLGATNTNVYYVRIRGALFGDHQGSCHLGCQAQLVYVTCVTISPLDVGDIHHDLFLLIKEKCYKCTLNGRLI